MRSVFFGTLRWRRIIAVQDFMAGEYSSASGGIGPYRWPPRSLWPGPSPEQEYSNGIIDGIRDSAIKEDICKGVTAR